MDSFLVVPLLHSVKVLLHQNTIGRAARPICDVTRKPSSIVTKCSAIWCVVLTNSDPNFALIVDKPLRRDAQTKLYRNHKNPVIMETKETQSAMLQNVTVETV
jgi:hypothetical protein